MAENQAIIRSSCEETLKDMDYHIKRDLNDGKEIFKENPNFHGHLVQVGNAMVDRVKECSSNNSIQSSTPLKSQYQFMSNPDGAFNNFHNFIDHKGYIVNQSKTFLNIQDPNKQYILTQKTISLTNNYNNKNKNIFQTFPKLYKSKNFKIMKDEKESSAVLTRKGEMNEKTSINAPCKKLKQNEIQFELLISATEKLISSGVVSMEELENLPMRERSDSDSDMEQNQTKEEEKANKNGIKKHRRCENKNCDSKPPKKNVKQVWVKIKVAKGKTKVLCSICAKAFKNKQYCYYCISIYKDNNNNFDGKDWICCDFCDSWHHINCEKVYNNKNIDKYLKQNPDYKYSCPWCRSKDKLTKDKLKNKKNKKKTDEDTNEENNRGSNLGKKLRNNYSNDNFEFLDFKPRVLRKKVNEFKPAYNHISSLNINDNRDIYHDYYKIMSDNPVVEVKK